MRLVVAVHVVFARALITVHALAERAVAAVGAGAGGGAFLAVPVCARRARAASADAHAGGCARDDIDVDANVGALAAQAGRAVAVADLVAPTAHVVGAARAEVNARAAPADRAVAAVSARADANARAALADRAAAAVGGGADLVAPPAHVVEAARAEGNARAAPADRAVAALGARADANVGALAALARRAVAGADLVAPPAHVVGARAEVNARAAPADRAVANVGTLAALAGRASAGADLVAPPAHALGAARAEGNARTAPADRAVAAVSARADANVGTLAALAGRAGAGADLVAPPAHVVGAARAEVNARAAPADRAVAGVGRAAVLAARAGPVRAPGTRAARTPAHAAARAGSDLVRCRGRGTTRALLCLAAAVAVAGAAQGARAAEMVPPRIDGAFWRAWGDGQAEIDGYTLVRDRYGEKRSGTVVAIFVTEPWSATAHVKADDGKHDKSDVQQVIKLNAVEDFQTGVYDYNLMTSSWAALTPSSSKDAVAVGATPKIAFSAQEWCGTTYADVVFDAKGGAAEIVRSYFDGESGAHSVGAPAGGPGLVEDALLLWARGFASPLVQPGDSVDVAFLPALARARLLHKPLAWTTARLSRDKDSVTVDVPAGHIACTRAHVAVADGRTIDLCVEVAAPHRVITSSASDGYALALTGTVRTPYWQKNHEGDEKLLDALGLHPPRSR